MEQDTIEPTAREAMNILAPTVIDLSHRYKAPHAYRGTPARPTLKKKRLLHALRMMQAKAKIQTRINRRLFR